MLDLQGAWIASFRDISIFVNLDLQSANSVDCISEENIPGVMDDM
jgi:hypothetical protein